jgi:anti-sigma factor RsiW
MPSDDRQNDERDDGSIDAAEEERMIRIMRYCDGVLPAREAAEVAEEIARDPDAARLAAEMSAGADAARSAFGNFDPGPVPLELARRVTQAARAPAPQSYPAPIRPLGVDWRIAAALVVGIGLGMLGLMLAQHDGEGLRLAGSERMQPVEGSDPSWQPALMSALAKDPETASVSFGAAGSESTVEVARWFDTAAGLRCAEFTKSTAGTVTAGGVACRKPAGGWDVIEQAR